MRANLLVIMRAGVAALVVYTGLLLFAAPASGHALVRATTPADGQELDAAPDEITIEFNEPVAIGPGGIRVFDDDGDRVDAGAATSEGQVVTNSLEPDLGDGTYVVSWRATSADGHPVHAAFVFTVGAATRSAEDLLEQVVSSDSDRTFEIAATIARFMQYTAALLAAGAAYFIVRIHDGAQVERAVLGRIIRIACVVAGLATVLAIALQAALVTGLGLSAAVSAEPLADVARSTFGVSALTLALGLVILAVATGRGGRPGWGVITVVAAAIVTASFVITGHTATTQPKWLVVVSDLAHTGAAAAWFGGLVALWVTLRRRRALDDAGGAAAMVGRFSAMATMAVVVVSLAGFGLAWAEVRATRALFSTSYGLTLIAKSVVVGLVLLIGFYNRRRLVPAVKSAGSAAWSRLRITVRTEAIGLTLALLVTAVLVNVVPARDAAGITGPLSVRADIGDEHQIDVTIEPNRAGPNEMHIYLFTDAGRPTEAEQLLVELEMPAQQIGPIEREPSVAGPGHWVLPAAEIPIAGRWTLRLTANLTRFDQVSTEIPIDVGG